LDLTEIVLDTHDFYRLRPEQITGPGRIDAKHYEVVANVSARKISLLQMAGINRYAFQNGCCIMSSASAAATFATRRGVSDDEQIPRPSERTAQGTWERADL
jgi:hypothetical protein